MPRVADHKPDIVVCRESDATGYIRRLGHIDCEVVVISQSAGTGSRRECVAAFVREVRGHN